MEEERVWLERLILRIEQPEQVEKQFSTARRYISLTIIFAVITLLLTPLLTKNYMVFAIGGFMVGMFFHHRASINQAHSNMVKTTAYLNKHAIEKRLEELKKL